MKDLIDSLFASDFPSFVRECHKNCRDGETLDPDPYLLQVCAMAEDIAEGRVTRAAISMPPGTAKTFIFGVCLPAWILAHKPSATVLVVEHNKKMARDTTRNIRKIMMSKRFRRNFDTRIDQNWSGAGDFGTTGGGSVYATSVSGGITGFRADVIIVDDPVSIKNANNVEKLELVNQIFDNEILSRARRPDTRILIIMQRLNKKDLIGQLQPEDGFKKLELPLIADKDRTYICRYGVWNRKKGEQLRAGHFTKKALRKLAFNPIFRFLYQQDKGGGASFRIKSRYFPYYVGRRDPSRPIVFSIDTAQKAGASSSRMVIQVWQTDGRDHYLLDVFAAVCDYERLWGELNCLVEKYPPSMILIEDASSGSSLISQATARLNCPIRGIVPRGTKSERFLRHFKTIRSGRVRVPVSADWIANWVEEILAFPEGEYDDHVDALSMYLDFMATRPHLVPVKRGGGLGVLVNTNGTHVILPGPANHTGTHRGCHAEPWQPVSAPVGSRHSLDWDIPERVETRLGPVIIRRR